MWGCGCSEDGFVGEDADGDGGGCVGGCSSADDLEDVEPVVEFGWNAEGDGERSGVVSDGAGDESGCGVDPDVDGGVGGVGLAGDGHEVGASDFEVDAGDEFVGHGEDASVGVGDGDERASALDGGCG